MRGTRRTKFEVRRASYEHALPSARPEALVGPSGATTHATARPHVILSDDHLPYAKSPLLREGSGVGQTAGRIGDLWRLLPFVLRSREAVGVGVAASRRTERGHHTRPFSFRPDPLQSPHHDPPARRTAPLRPQRAPPRPRRRHRRRGEAALPADELHRLERRPPRLAGAALLAAPRAGPTAAARHQRALRLRRSRH